MVPRVMSRQRQHMKCLQLCMSLEQSMKRRKLLLSIKSTCEQIFVFERSCTVFGLSDRVDGFALESRFDWFGESVTR